MNTKRTTFHWLAAAAIVVLGAQLLLSAAAQPPAPVLSGTAANWEGGEARLAAESFTAEGEELLGPLAETTIAADGSFKLALPAEVPAELLSEITAADICEEGGVTATPERFMGAGVFGLTVYQGEGEAPVGFVGMASSQAVISEEEGAAQVGDFAVFHVYADRPVTIRGSCVSESETDVNTIDLQPGWNTIVSSATAVTEEGNWSDLETRAGETPAGAGWHFAAMPEGEAAAEVVFNASTPGEGAPEQVAPGYTVLSLDNDTETGHNLTLFRLKKGATIEAFREAIAAIDQAFLEEGGDPSSAINAALELADVLGEAYADEPGKRGSFGVVLEEGQYWVEITPDSEEGAPERFYQAVAVAGEPQAPAPQADVAVKLVDFAFALPPGIEAGPQTWEVANVGAQIHHMVLFRLLEGKTMDDFTAWMETEGEGEPAAEEAGGVGIMSSGQTSYVDLDLAPGEYVAICFMPDHAAGGDGAPHFAKGMMQTFAVAGE